MQLSHIISRHSFWGTAVLLFLNAHGLAAGLHGQTTVYGPSSEVKKAKDKSDYSQEAQRQKKRFSSTTVQWSFKRDTIVDQENAEKALNPLGFTAKKGIGNPQLTQIDECGQSCLYQKANERITLDQVYSNELLRGAIQSYKGGSNPVDSDKLKKIFEAFGESCSKQKADFYRTAASDPEKKAAAKECLELAGSERARNILVAGQAELQNAASAAELNGGAVIDPRRGEVLRIDPGQSAPRWNSKMQMGRTLPGVKQVVYIPTLSEAGQTDDDGDLDKEFKILKEMSQQEFDDYKTIEIQGAAGIVNLSKGKKIDRDVRDSKQGHLKLHTASSNTEAQGDVISLQPKLSQLSMKLSTLPVPVLGRGSRGAIMPLTSVQREAYKEARRVAIEAIDAQQAGRAPAKTPGGVASINVGPQSGATKKKILGKKADHGDARDGVNETFHWDVDAMTRNAQSYINTLKKLK